MKPKSNGFIKIDHALIRTAAWQALTPGEIALLIEIWGRHNGKNNGRITYSWREAQRRFKCGLHTVKKSFDGLQQKGFIAATRRGSFGQKAGPFVSRATEWRLTMEPCDGQQPTRDFLAWMPPQNLESVCRGGSAPYAQIEGQPRTVCYDSIRSTPKAYAEAASHIDVSYQGKEEPARPPAAAWVRCRGTSVRPLARQERAVTGAQLHAVLNDPDRLALFAASRTLAIWAALVLAQGRAAA